MSTQTAVLRGAVKQADNDIGDWLVGLVSGQGSSPSQVIVSGILSVVPGLGQAMDLRDIVAGIVAISKSPASPMAWLDISITLIGCIPVMGDALKTSFRLLKSGKSLSRVLDAASPKLRGNLDQWFRQIKWTDISRSVRTSFDDVLEAFVNGLDSWVIKTVAGRKEVDFLIAQLKDMRARAPKMLDQAIIELKAMWSKALGDGVPKSTASVTAPRPALATAAPSVGKGTRPRPPATRKPDNTSRDKSAGTATTPDKPRTDDRRASRNRNRRNMAVLAEHLTDYWCARSRRNLKKANNGGRLWEEWDKDGRPGIDHLWVQAGNPTRPGVVADTKSSLFGAFKLLAALPPDIRRQLNELSETEESSPTPSGQPNIFQSQGRDSVDPSKVRTDGTPDAERSVRRTLDDTKTKGVQMSHRWIALSLGDEKLTTAGVAMLEAVMKFRKRRLVNKSTAPPYARWIVMVSGRQKHLHERKQGHQHEIQKPLVTLPDNILE